MERKELNQSLEIKYELMQKDIKHINCSIDDIRSYIKEDRKWKESLDCKLDNRYAGKYIETIAITSLGGVIVGIVLILLGNL